MSRKTSLPAPLRRRAGEHYWTALILDLNVRPAVPLIDVELKNVAPEADPETFRSGERQGKRTCQPSLATSEPSFSERQMAMQ